MTAEWKRGPALELEKELLAYPWTGCVYEEGIRPIPFATLEVLVKAGRLITGSWEAVHWLVYDSGHIVAVTELVAEAEAM